MGRPAEELHWSWRTLGRRLYPNKADIRIFGWFYILPLAGLTAEMRDERTAPNEGIRRSARNAVACGLVVGLYWLFLPVVAQGTSGPLTSELSGDLKVGLIIGLAGAMIFGGGACLVHYSVRLSLFNAGAIPLRYGLFLDAMTERLLLRRSGSGYLFAHRLLRDYLADLKPKSVATFDLSPASPSATIPSPERGQ